MSQAERNRIYKEQLRLAQKKQWEMLSKHLNVILMFIFDKMGVEAKSVTGVASVLGDLFRELFKKYKKGIITVVVAFCVIFGVRGLFNAENVYVLKYTHGEDSMERQVLTEHIAKKLETIPEMLSNLQENPANPRNDEYSRRIEEKKQVLKENFSKAKMMILEFVEKLGEELKK